MEKITLNHHASTILAKCDETGEFLLGQYDPEYPGKNKHWIGRVKLLGGNFFFGKDSEISPYKTLIREISEEFSGEKAKKGEMSASQEHKFASLSEIELVKNYLLDVKPLGDYFAHQPSPEDKPQVYVIQSVFRTNLPKEIMECVKDNISAGKSLTNEGFLAIKTLNELVQAKPLCQGLSGLIIGQTEGITLPHCLIDLITFAPIGLPREDYKSYLDRFEYRNHSQK